MFGLKQGVWGVAMKMLLRLFVTKFALLAALVICNCTLQTLHINYCKRNLVLYYLMREATICKILKVLTSFTEETGLGYLENVIPFPKGLMI